MTGRSLHLVPAAPSIQKLFSRAKEAFALARQEQAILVSGRKVQPAKKKSGLGRGKYTAGSRVKMALCMHLVPNLSPLDRDC